MVGLGFGGVPSEDLMDEIEGAYAARGAPTQVELTHLADPEIGVMLTGRGYRLVAFENVLGKPLDASATPRDVEGVEIRLSGEDELDDWLEVVTTGFAHPDEQGVATHEDFPREIVERAERDFVAGRRANLSRAAGRSRRGRWRPAHDGRSRAIGRGRNGTGASPTRCADRPAVDQTR